ncbi:enoyl-CoA hydratase-related protein [Parahaliea mediterranea]|uniref:Enoyl-CoA hydratase/isomerase family protein n=1 Tax=Parahaliea mediterranea TaxID=651086 RepID=A0A939DIE7_9GAMM|nr:enoyl-CoA hydratase-related protein [Parahaliea mediterranea]MBN7798844.1 enoyl-CoA hydratase/isomerase family protein [Parahaliea mediterranea]
MDKDQTNATYQWKSVPVRDNGHRTAENTSPSQPATALPDTLKVTTAGGVTTITLADTDNRNALGAAMLQGLRDAIAAANADPAVRAIVLTNEGSTFCAGANLKEQSSKGNQPGAFGGFELLLGEILESPTPVIGRIAGHVVGGGMGLAAALDIAIARDDVKFGFTEVRLGVVPAIISVVCLPKMRLADAREAFLRGHRFAGSRAAEMGLINRAVPGDELDTAVGEVLADLRKGGPNALHVAKQLIRKVPGMDPKQAFTWAAGVSQELFAGEEAAEGMDAFLNKRPPKWAEQE